ncbi:MAG TPA: flagellar hook-length control protein FliK [Ramlibacter sp.]|nr:flagellar hook-length control protein FliK [Ramlibacter sp.]
MIGLPGSIDTAPADKLAPWPDVLRLPLSSVVPGPGPSQPLGAISRDTGVRADPSGHPAVAADHGAPMPAAPAGAPAPPAEQEFSAAARAISALLADLDPLAAAVQGSGPLLDQAPLQPDHRLPQALSAALSNSGLFYESHLAALAAGVAQPQDLAGEPQARLAPRHGDSAGTHAESTRLALAPGERNAASAAPLVQPPLKLLVSQQLELLATGVFQWRGEAWPGVPMQWRVEQQPDRQPANRGSNEPSRWSTTIVLDMPALGRIEARITVAGGDVGVHLQAQPGTTRQLRADAASVRARLQSAGLQVPQLAVTEVQRP